MLLCCFDFFFNLVCSAMLVFFNLQCSANAVSSMLVGLTAFYLFPRFAHTLKFQSNDVAKVYAYMYWYMCDPSSVNTFDVMCHHPISN